MKSTNPATSLKEATIAHVADYLTEQGCKILDAPTEFLEETDVVYMDDGVLCLCAVSFNDCKYDFQNGYTSQKTAEQDLIRLFEYVDTDSEIVSPKQIRFDDISLRIFTANNSALVRWCKGKYGEECN